MGVGAQAIALERLKAKLVVLAEERQLAEVAELRGDAVKAEWGQQVKPRLQIYVKRGLCVSSDMVRNIFCAASCEESA